MPHLLARSLPPTRSRLLGAVLLAVALIGSGCGASHKPTALLPGTSPSGRAASKTSSVPHGRKVIGNSYQRRPIELLTYGEGKEIVLIIATIHGNENAGTPLVGELGRHLLANPRYLAGRTVLVMPVANPDGFAKNSRTNARGVDLNRNFPAFNREERRQYGPEGLSEPESKIIHRVLERYKPTRIVSIHQPLECIDWDGPAEDLALHMGQFSDLPVRRLGSRPGSLGSYAGEDLEIPIITYELPRSADKHDARTLWKLYGRALLAAITYPE